MCPCVVRRELQMIRHLAIKLNCQRVVVGANAAEDLRHGPKALVGARRNRRRWAAAGFCDYRGEQRSRIGTCW